MELDYKHNVVKVRSLHVIPALSGKWVPPAVPNSGTRFCRGASLKLGSKLSKGYNRL